MKLNVSIEYRTNWGEEIVLCLGGKRYPLAYVAEGIWKGGIDRFNPAKASEYSYEVVRDGMTVRKEWRKHSLVLPEGAQPKVLNVYDKWNDRPEDSPFYSSAFSDAIFGRKPEKSKKAPKGANVLIQVAAPSLRPNEVLALAGSGKALKDWTKVVPFDGGQFPVWNLALEVSEPFSYKLLVADKNTLVPIAWEDSANRWFINVPEKDEFTVEADAQVRFSGRNWKGAGTAIPVFSLRTEDDFGVGEFYDLKKMVDWAAATGQSILQLLPINDTTMLHTWEDSYPYNPNSTFALHPQFLHLPAAGVKVDEEYKALQAELNALDQIDYERVNSLKLELLRKAYEKTFKKLSAKPEYQAFVEKNSHWLLPYAAFCVLRDQNGTPDFTQWKGYAKYNKKKIAAFCEENKADVDFWCMFICHRIFRNCIFDNRKFRSFEALKIFYCAWNPIQTPARYKPELQIFGNPRLTFRSCFSQSYGFTYRTNQ